MQLANFVQHYAYKPEAVGGARRPTEQSEASMYSQPEVTRRFIENIPLAKAA